MYLRAGAGERGLDSSKALLRAPRGERGLGSAETRRLILPRPADGRVSALTLWPAAVLDLRVPLLAEAKSLHKFFTY